MKSRITFWIAVPAGVAFLFLAPVRPTAQSVDLVHRQLHHFVASPTATARQSGAWSEAATWGGVVPGSRARVFIPSGVTVTVDREIATAYEWINVDGTLRFRPDATTALTVETLHAMGRIEIGTDVAPIQPHVTAKLIIRSLGTPIDHGVDPLELTRGFIPMSPVSIHGSPKREISALAALPAAGATSLQLALDPTNWQVGDEILVAPTLYGQDEVVRVTSINGRTIGISPALRFTRQNVPTPLRDGPSLPMPIQVHVGNLTRNVIVQTDPSHAGNPQLQGHTMLMGGGHRIFHAAFTDLGRTRARNADRNFYMPVTDPLLLPDGTRDPQLMPLCDTTEENIRGRYSLHFHNPGPGSPLSIVEGVVVRVQREKGFKIGIQNHSAHVAVRRYIVHQIDGSGVFSEEGDERGEYRDGLVVHSRGSNLSNSEAPRDKCSEDNYPQIHHRRRIDFGHRGAGLWLQGNQVSIIGNVFAGHDHGGIDHSASGLDKGKLNTFEILVKPSELSGGDWWLKQGRYKNIPYDPNVPLVRVNVPPGQITDNHFYAIGSTYKNSRKAAFVVEFQLQLERWIPRPKNLMARNLAWNVVNCFDAAYSSWGDMQDMACIAGSLPPGNMPNYGRYGINTQRQDGMHWNYTRVRIEGFTAGTNSGLPGASGSVEFVPSDHSYYRDVFVNGQPFVPSRFGVLLEACGDGVDNNGNGQIDEGCLGDTAQTTSPEAPRPPQVPTDVRIIRHQ